MAITLRIKKLGIDIHMLGIAQLKKKETIGKLQLRQDVSPHRSTLLCLWPTTICNFEQETRKTIETTMFSTHVSVQNQV